MVNEIAQGVILGLVPFALFGIGIVMIGSREELPGMGFFWAGIVFAALVFAWPWIRVYFGYY